MFDSHIHTKFSTDSTMNIEDAIKRAEELNIGLVITEHMDINFPIEGSFIFDPKEYFNEYSKFRGDKLLLGIELGMRDDCIEENKAIVSENPFDYVIGSLHFADNIDVFQEEFYAGKTKKEAYEHYLKFMAECLKTHTFIDSLGHIDYISRYAQYDDKEIYYEDFTDHIDTVLKTAVSNDKALEINTRRLNDKIAVKNLIKIYNRFYELGGRMVTTGSDSHKTSVIGNNLNIAKEIAAICNLKIVYFKNRKPEYV